MHKTVGEARALASELVEQLGESGADVVLCPPFTALTAVAEAVAGSPIHLGAQDVYWQAEGAYTGEISPAMLADVGCRFVIVGHSERRQLFGETDEHVARKVKAALGAGLTPIVCVGEGWPERERGETEAKVALQVRAALAWIRPEHAAGLVFAYEPIWAIGTGKNADGDTAAAVCRHIRDEVAAACGRDAAEQVRILYGGSVKPDNIGEFAAQRDIDGALVGGASLSAPSFAAIVRGWASEERG